jgi:uncharacterized membrane protein
LQFGGVWPTWLVLLFAALGSVAVWYWYFRESRYSREPYRTLLPSLRAAAFALIVLMLAGPSWYQEWTSGELSRIAVLVDTSSSMDLTDLNPSGDERRERGTSRGDSATPTKRESTAKTRLERISEWLSDGDSKNASGWLSQQRRSFHTQVQSFDSVMLGEERMPTQWDSWTHPVGQPVTLELRPTGIRTALGDAIASVVRSASDAVGPSDSTSDRKPSISALIVLSDGQSNAGESPIAVAERAAKASIPIFAIAYGAAEEPEDLGIQSVEHSRNLFRTDDLQGRVTLKQQLPTDSSFEVQVWSHGEKVWNQSFESDGNSIRTIDFRIEGEKLFGAQEVSTRRKAVPIDIEFRAVHGGDDASSANDRYASSLWGVVRRNRVLVMDERGRWETRYIKNAFQRDATWDLVTALGPTEFKQKQFPKSRDELLDLDLIVLTLESVASFNEVQLQWLEDFVAEMGGGLVWIDSGRERPPTRLTERPADWLPIRFDDDLSAVPFSAMDLKDSAIDQRAFAFDEDAAANRRLWQAFPPPRVVRRVEAAAGAEVLVVGKSESNREWPLVVTRRFGQGRVVYLASDETWRWRYNVADLYHQRFWNQLAQWTMQTPFAVENDYVALDSGDRTVEVGQAVAVRARIRDANFLPLTGGRVRAVLSREGVTTEEVTLSEDPDTAGTYTTNLKDLPPGNYAVRLDVVDVPNEALDLMTEFVVRPPQDLETQALSANRDLLERVAEGTGGQCWDEADRSRLSEALKRFQTGKIEQSQTLLWQSYPWFLAVIALLSAEWFLRKRAGLV